MIDGTTFGICQTLVIAIRLLLNVPGHKQIFGIFKSGQDVGPAQHWLFLPSLFSLDYRPQGSEGEGF